MPGDSKPAAGMTIHDFKSAVNQRTLLAQALGDLLVATGLIREVPLTGPELLAFAAQLTEDLKEQRIRLVTMTYDSGTMEGPLCPECGHLLPANGKCLIGHPSLTDLHVLDLSPEPGTLLYRPATVADLVSALRAEGVLVVEKVDREWPAEFLPTIAVALRVGAKKGRTVPQLDINEQQGYALAEAVLVAFDALAEAQR